MGARRQAVHQRLTAERQARLISHAAIPDNKFTSNFEATRRSDKTRPHVSERIEPRANDDVRREPDTMWRQ